MTITLDGGPKQNRAVTHLVHAMLRMACAGVSTVSDWRAARSLQRIDDAVLKDIGVSRGGIDWTVRHGRAER